MNELSPATQVMIAVTHVCQAHGGNPPARAIAAAALRAAALYWKAEDLAMYLEETADELEAQP